MSMSGVEPKGYKMGTIEETDEHRRSGDRVGRLGTTTRRHDEEPTCHAWKVTMPMSGMGPPKESDDGIYSRSDWLSHDMTHTIGTMTMTMVWRREFEVLEISG